MANNTPFQALTNQYCVAATTAASTAVQIAPPSGLPVSAQQYRIANNGTVPVQFVLTAASAAATLTASGANGAGYTILAGVTETFGGPPNAWFSCITATGTSQMCVSGGDGL